MKRLLCIVFVVVLLSGCAGVQGDLDRAMALRSRLLGEGVRFTAEVTADYGDELYSFTMECEADSKGNVNFSVLEPETIAGIAGTIDAAGGKLKFDDQVLAFPLMADGQFSPVAGPWILMKTLRSGYLTSAGAEGELLRVAIDDSYADDALHLDIWLDGEDRPVRAEVIWQGRRLLSITVKSFAFL